MKVAMVQQKAVPNDKNANLQLALKYIKEAHSMGADLVLFPEMWSNGYAPPFDGVFDNPLDLNFCKERVMWLQNAIAIDSEYVMALRNITKELHIGVCATYLSKTISEPQNTAVIIRAFLKSRAHSAISTK